MVNILLTWKPNYQEFQELFANEHSLMILMIIYEQSQKKVYPCAADIAKILDIHISTVTKYLNLLCKYKLVKKEQILNKPGKPTYFKSQINTLSINLEISFLAQEFENIVNESILRNPLVREKPNLQPRVVYDFDDDGTIKSFVIQQKTKAKRTIKRKITLNSFESNFMKFLPHPTEEIQHFLNICNNAGIYDFITMKMLLLFLEKLEKYEIIELRQNKGDYNE